MNRLEVKTSKLQIVMAILLGLFLVPLGLFTLIRGISSFAVAPLLIGLVVLVLYGAVIWLVRRGHSRSVRYFSEEGLVRNDGRSFPWTDLSRVVNQIRIVKGTRSLWRTEIHFKNGDSAWLLPLKVANLGEVSEYVHKLPCEHTEVMV